MTARTYFNIPGLLLFILATLYFSAPSYGNFYDKYKQGLFDEETYQVVKSLADEGDAEAQFFVYRYLIEGWSLEGKKPEKANRYLNMSFEANYPPALLVMSSRYYFGWESAQDFEISSQLYTKAVNTDDFTLETENNFLDNMYDGVSGFYRQHGYLNNSDSMDGKWKYVRQNFWRLYKSAIEGDGDDAFEFAEYLRKSIHLYFDSVDAWYYLAASRKNPNSLFKIGRQYYVGDKYSKIYKRDFNLASQFFLLAVEEGSTEAKSYLAKMEARAAQKREKEVAYAKMFSFVATLIANAPTSNAPHHQYQSPTSNIDTDLAVAWAGVGTLW